MVKLLPLLFWDKLYRISYKQKKITCSSFVYNNNHNEWLHSIMHVCPTSNMTPSLFMSFSFTDLLESILPNLFNFRYEC